MKIIFLDCDGVLNSMECGFGVPQDDKIQKLSKIVDATDAKIILSSSWRYAERYEDSQGVKMLYNSLVNHLKEFGIFIYDSTPILGTQRGLEIDAWLKSSKENIEAFVILDDDDDMEPHLDHLVKTDYRYGLSDENVKKAIQILEQ